MLRHYYAQWRRGGVNPLGVGVIALGSIYYIQDAGYSRARFVAPPVRRNPWSVEAFLNGELQAARRDPQSGRWPSIADDNRTDSALVRSLRDGRRRTIAIRVLELYEDKGFGVPDNPYPTLPKLVRSSLRGRKLIAQAPTA